MVKYAPGSAPQRAALVQQLVAALAQLGVEPPEPSERTHKAAMSVEEFAERYGLSRTSAYAEIRSGRLKSYRAGRRRFVSVEAGAEWQRSLEQAAAAEREAA